MFGFIFQGMDAIEQMDPAKFSHYLKEYENTICGRYPIGVLLSVSSVDMNNHSRKVPHFRYEQLKSRLC